MRAKEFFITFAILIFIILIAGSGIIFLVTQIQIIDSQNKTQTRTNTPGALESIIRPIVENTSIENGDCLTYTLYYKEKINQTYPELDIRKINKAGICPIGTEECGEWAGYPHTYLIINGHGGECLLDQHKLICIQIINKTKHL